MGFELHATNSPQYFNIVDGHGRLGCLWYMEADEEDDGEGWVVSMQKAIEVDGTWSSAPMPTAAEAVREAWTLYGLLLEDRRTLARFYRNREWRVISTPMGGQPR